MKSTVLKRAVFIDRRRGETHVADLIGDASRVEVQTFHEFICETVSVEPTTSNFVRDGARCALIVALMEQVAHQSRVPDVRHAIEYSLRYMRDALASVGDATAKICDRCEEHIGDTVNVVHPKADRRMRICELCRPAFDAEREEHEDS